MLARGIMFVKVEWSAHWQDVRTAVGARESGLQTHLIEPIEDEIENCLDSYNQTPSFKEDWYQVTSNGRTWKGTVWFELPSSVAPLQSLERLEGVDRVRRFDSEPSPTAQHPTAQ